jgi:signal transduction histidine kinase
MSFGALTGFRNWIGIVQFRALLFGALAALLVLVWAGGAVQLWLERSSYIALAERATESLSLALAEYTRQSLENVDNTLQDIVVQSPAWADPRRRQAAAEYLRVLSDRDSIIRSIRIYDARGQLWLSSETQRPDFPQVGEREDFLIHKSATKRGMYIGLPQRTATGELRYPVSRGIAGPRGEFQGIAVVNLDVATFEKFFGTLDVGDDGLTILLRQDAVLLIRRPKLDAAIGRFPFSAIIPALAAKAPEGAFTFTSQIDQIVRIGHYRVVEPYPLIASVAIAVDHALAPWRRLLLQFGVTLGLITLAVFLLGWLVVRQHALFEQAEARARDRQQQLEGISLNMPAVVFQRIRHRNGRSHYTFVDPKIRDVFGVDPEEVKEGVAALNAVTHPDDVQVIQASFEQSARQLSMWRHEFRIEPPSKGLQWIRGAATPRPGPAGEVIWDGVYFNITAEKQSEEHLQRAYRMETVGQLASGIAHQFNNLLMSIQGHLELIQLETEKQGPVAGNAGAALEAVQRGAALTRQLLAFSRRQRLEPTAFNLNEALKETGELLSGLLGRTIRITFQLQEDLPGVRVDRGQFQTAIVALSLNAREAMPQGGTLAIATAVEDLPEDKARTALTTPGRYVTVRVRDSGVGMPEAIQLRAFEPFFTTKGMGQGAGLGLSQVHGFMKQSGGHATLHSLPNQGTEVALYFPIHREASGGQLDSTRHPQ